jgi:hypothetical protein
VIDLVGEMDTIGIIVDCIHLLGKNTYGKTMAPPL